MRYEDDSVASFDVRRDGYSVVSGGRIAVFRPGKRYPLSTLVFSSTPMIHAMLSRRRHRVYFVCHDGRFGVWDYLHGRFAWRKTRLSSPVTSAAIDNYDRLLIGCARGEVYLIAADRARQIAQLDALVTAIKSLATGKKFAAASLSGQVVFGRSWRPIHHIQLPKPAVDIGWLYDRRVVFALDDGQLYWQDGTVVKAHPLISSLDVYRGLILTAGSDGYMRCWSRYDLLYEKRVHTELLPLAKFTSPTQAAVVLRSHRYRVFYEDLSYGDDSDAAEPDERYAVVAACAG